MINNVKIAKVLSDPIRYKIMIMLARSESNCCPKQGEEDQRVGLCNCELMTELGLIQSRVSYHMKELVETGLVTEEPRGKWKMYYINNTNMLKFIEQLNQDFSLK